MRKILAAVACAAATSTVVLATPSASQAAEVDQLCYTNSDAVLFDSPDGTGYFVPKGSLVRIRDYRGPYHYLARFNGHVGQLERSRVIQSSCYFQ